MRPSLVPRKLPPSEQVRLDREIQRLARDLDVPPWTIDPRWPKRRVQLPR